ncbi:hypothetical protein [Nonomuraea jabiensis]
MTSYHSTATSTSGGPDVRAVDAEAAVPLKAVLVASTATVTAERSR